MYTITRREIFSDTTFLWEVMAPDVAKSAEPGHFVMLRLREGSERIPLTVADYDPERGTVTLVIQSLGKTTLEMRDQYKEGDSFVDFVGPLGLPQHVDKVGHVVLVGGGLVSFWGPVLGVLLYFVARDVLGGLTETWLLWYGLMFMAMVVLRPEGLAGMIHLAAKRIRALRKPPVLVAEEA